jgi:AraC-like DNA-binding protein
MKWITREKPKIDRIACPWLILRFIDPAAEILYVPFGEVEKIAAQTGAIPFDVPGVELTHSGDQCTFDCLLKKYRLKDKALLSMAPIIRGADTDRHEIAPQSAGLWAISAGLAHNFKEDQELLRQGLILYDGLYSWARFLQDEKHIQQPFEHLLARMVRKLSGVRPGKNKKVPAWARELREMIQDQIDTHLSLKEISKELAINPSYLSREFSKYFEDLSFGDYIRQKRIDRAKELMHSPEHSLTSIAYLTGFSDQSHFTRIFKKSTGMNPSVYRKKMIKK